MKTTLEIPNPVFRRAKSRAAERGIPLRQFLTEAVEDKLRLTRGTGDNFEGFASKLSQKGQIKEISTITVVPLPRFQTTFTVGGPSIYFWAVAFNYPGKDGKPYTFFTDPVALTCRVPSPKA